MVGGAGKVFLGIAAAILMTACGSFDGGGGDGSVSPTPTPGQNNFSNAQAGSAAGQLKGSSEQSARFYETDPNDPGQADAGFAGPTPCNPTITGDASDPDLDGYPTDVSVTYDCGFAPAQITDKGSLIFQDTQPNTAAFAFHSETDLEVSVGGEVRNIVKATLDADEQNGTYSLAVSDAEVSSEVTSSGVKASVTGDWSSSYKPVAAWDPSDPIADGDLTVDGTWLVLADSGTPEASASVAADITTLQPLTIDSSCDTHIVAGEIEGSGEVNAGGTTVTETFHITWNGCDNVTAEYNGAIVNVP